MIRDKQNSHHHNGTRNVLPIKFSDQDRYSLIHTCGLSDKIIDEIEKELRQFKREYSCYFVNIPSPPKEKKQIDSIRKSVARLFKQLSQIDPYIEDRIEWATKFNFGRAKERVLRDLVFINNSTFKIEALRDKGKAGNKKIDHHNLNHLICTITRVLVKNDFIPKSHRNKQFTKILGTVFKSMGEKESSARTMLEDHWGWGSVIDAIIDPDGELDFDPSYES